MSVWGSWTVCLASLPLCGQGVGLWLVHPSGRALLPIGKQCLQTADVLCVHSMGWG